LDGDHKSPGELLAATLLMRDWRDDGGFATAIRPLAYVRGYESLKGGWQFYGVGRHGCSSIGDTRASEDRHRSENVAFDALSCATVPISSEGGPAKWLKIKNL